MKSYLSRSEKDTREIAQKILSTAKEFPTDGACVVALYGDLGSGKTTTTKLLGEMLGINGVKSPTFLIIDMYPITFGQFHKLIHIDAYRLKGPGELLNLGFLDMLKDRQNLIVVEWPKIVESVLPNKILRVDLKFIDENTREISI